MTSVWMDTTTIERKRTKVKFSGPQTIIRSMQGGWT
jgi:hypothetical protein